MARAQVHLLLAAALSAVTAFSAHAFVEQSESCDNAVSRRASSLIQVRSGQEAWPLGDGVEDTTTPEPSVVDDSLAVKPVPKEGDIPEPPSGSPSDIHLSVKMLPANLKAEGEAMFGSKEKLAKALENAVILNVSYAGVDMRLALPKDDEAVDRYVQVLPEYNGQEYGLHTLLQPIDMEEMAFEVRRNASETSKFVNFIDLGGHVGAVTIALYKKYPGLVRGVVVEPVPSTFFFLSLNLWLNYIPPLNMPKTVMKPEALQPGVTAIQRALYGQPGQKNVTVNLCTPYGRLNKTSTLGSYVVTAGRRPCNCSRAGQDICSTASTTTIEKLFAFFPTEDISLLKMNCEGCEEDALLTLDSAPYRARLRRVGGELHSTRPFAATIACSLPGKGAYMSGICASNPAAGYLHGTEFCTWCK